MNTSHINDYANRSFRNSADKDYILGRISHRNEFDQQFLWCSLQAVEKYLKAILLYNGKSAKGIGHNLLKALRKVESIHDLFFQLPNDVVSFIGYLDEYGGNRYLIHPTYLRERSLLELDKTIWYIRRYCYYMRRTIDLEDGNTVSLIDFEIKKIHKDKYEKKPHTYKIYGGYLEKILKEKLPVAKHLVWKNFYYGLRNKQFIEKPGFRMTIEKPIHFVFPEAFEDLDGVVDFPRQLRNHFLDKMS